MIKYAQRRRYSQVGDVLNPSTDQNCGLLNFGVFRPSCWAAQYEKTMYDGVPRITSAPTPDAPQTLDEMTTPGAWTPEDGIRDSVSNWSANVRALMAADAEAGRWNPAGNFPVSATQLSDAVTTASNYKVPLMILGGAVGFLILLKVAK